MDKFFIKNRKNQRIKVITEQQPNQKGLAIIMHGLGGSKNETQIQLFAKAFQEEGYTTIRFDTTNTFGESDGNYEDATTTNYYEDLEDVIEWASSQSWSEEPFILAGHSIGGICTSLFAQKHPEKVKALAPISSVISGELSLKSPRYEGKDILKTWEETGWRIEKSISVPGRIKKLKWAHIQDRLKYNLLENADKLTMPVLLIVGDKDKSTPLEHQKLLYNKLPGKKELHVIKNAPHTFRDEFQLREIKEIIKNWIKKLI